MIKNINTKKVVRKTEVSSFLREEGITPEAL